LCNESPPVSSESHKRAKKLKINLISSKDLLLISIAGAGLMVDEINRTFHENEFEALLGTKRIKLELDRRSIEVVNKINNPDLFK
jgi:hypothetical protein